MPNRQEQKTDPAPDDHLAMSELESFIGYNMKRAYVIVHNDFREALGKDGLAPRVFSALALVVQFPNISQSELARMLGIERSGLVATVDDLEARGFVARATVPGDRRVQALVPLAAGEAALRETVKRVQAHEEALFAHLSRDEKATLLSLLKKVRQHKADS